MDVTRQVRKAIRDIVTTLEQLTIGQQSDECTLAARKAIYQLDCLREMLDLPPQRRQPWSYFQPRITEEFGG